MKKKNFTFVVYCILFFVIWFIALNLIYTVKAVRKAFAEPKVVIQLNEPIFMVSVNVEAEPVVVGWHMLDSGFVYMRQDGYVWLNQSVGNTVVSIEESQIRSSRDNKHILSKEELRNLLTNICNGVSSGELEFEIKDYSRYSSEMTIGVSGEYEGFFVLKDGHLAVPVGDTNLEQVWSAKEHFPYRVILLCIVLATFIVTLLSSIGYYLSKKTNSIKPYLLINGIPIVLLISYIIFLAMKGYFGPI